MDSPNILTAHKQEYPLSLILHMMTNHRYLPAHNKYLSSYFILKWAGSYIRGSVVNGKIKKDGKEWNVIWQGTTPAQLKHTPSKQFFVSFREIDSIKYGRVARYVLIYPA